jgi:hypothetical protein
MKGLTGDGRVKARVMFAVDPRYCFVCIAPTIYLRCDVAAAFVDCPVCGAKRGTPCENKNTAGGYKSAAHFQRRYALSGERNRR